MRENIATIPLIDAFKADGECPFGSLTVEYQEKYLQVL